MYNTTFTASNLCTDSVTKQESHPVCTEAHSSAAASHHSFAQLPRGSHAGATLMRIADRYRFEAGKPPCWEKMQPKCNAKADKPHAVAKKSALTSQTYAMLLNETTQDRPQRVTLKCVDHNAKCTC